MANSITTLQRAFRGGFKPKSTRAYITPLDGANGDRPVEDGMRSFQYFPSTISDNKSSNYQTKVIPGLSHPLYQWTSGGSREVSFQAIFTRDRTLSDEEYKNANGGVVGSFFSSVGGGGKDPRNVDVSSAVAWLRSFMDPEYGDSLGGLKGGGIRRPLPPRKMILTLPGVRMNAGVEGLTADDMYCIMLSCDTVYESFFGDGTVRKAILSLTFAEIIQVNGTIRPHSALDRRYAGESGYRLKVKGNRDT